MYRSSCYRTSRTTNSWDYARQDCERKRANLVIFNDLDEEVFVFFIIVLLPRLPACVHLPLLTVENAFLANRVSSLILTALLKRGSAWELKKAVPAPQCGRGWMDPHPPTSEAFQRCTDATSPSVTECRLQLYAALCFAVSGTETFPSPARTACFFDVDVCSCSGCKTTVGGTTTGCVRGSRGPCRAWLK